MDMEMPELELTQATLAERQIVRNLMELYQYETSVYQDEDIGPLGLYLYRYFDHYWTEDGRHPFLIRVSGVLAGFVLVNQHAIVSKLPDTRVIAEFFILAKFRRSGIGRLVATQLFDMFPGPWEVQEVGRNEAAVAFWRSVIGGYTGGRYHEEVLDNEDWTGPVQTFASRGR
jgi:predicted acetyltransferase